MDEKSTWSPTWRIMNKGYMVSRNFRQSHLLETVKFQETMIFLNFFQHDKILDTLQGKFQSRVQDKQTPLGNYLKLIEFETYYFKPNPPLFFWPTKYAMVPQHGPLSLHTMLRACDQLPGYGLWMRVKGPHHYKVTALGSCVKWPLGLGHWRSYYSLPSINVNPREWIKVNIYNGVNN